MKKQPSLLDLPPNSAVYIRVMDNDWVHPTDDMGQYHELKDGEWSKDHKNWLEGYNLWVQEQIETESGVIPKPTEYYGMTYSDFAGPIPSPDMYFPRHPNGTCYFLYLGGIPLSPGYPTRVELISFVDRQANRITDKYILQLANFKQIRATITEMN